MEVVTTVSITSTTDCPLNLEATYIEPVIVWGEKLHERDLVFEVKVSIYTLTA